MRQLEGLKGLLLGKLNFGYPVTGELWSHEPPAKSILTDGTVHYDLLVAFVEDQQLS